MQVLGGCLNRAAIFSHRRTGDPKCGKNYCNRLHLHSPFWLMRVRPVRLFDDPRHMPASIFSAWSSPPHRVDPKLIIDRDGSFVNLTL